MSVDLDALRRRQPAMLDDLAVLVACESPSSDVRATDACAAVCAELIAASLGSAPEVVLAGGRRHLRWRGGPSPRVAVLGHFDTVWPLGTASRWPFGVEGGRATGPGVFDMKAGIVQAVHALAAVDPSAVELLLTSDEELGSPSSRDLVEEAARRVGAVLVLEPSGPGGALKIARKGVSQYRLEIGGRAAHAGLEPERGVNALLELAHQALALAGLARPELGTTVTPTTAFAGSALNVVPSSARLELDVRAATVAEQERVDAELRRLRSAVGGATVVVEGGINRRPLEASASAALFARARRLAERLGLGALAGVEVGGGSDGNFSAGVGTPTLDGLGPVGDGAHAEGEHVVVDSMPERAALVAGLVEELRAG